MSCGMPQDGYALVSTDGPEEYNIAFEAWAGAAAGHLKAGTVAYITTGIYSAFTVDSDMLSYLKKIQGRLA